VLPTRAAEFTAPLMTKLTREFDDGCAWAFDAAIVQPIAMPTVQRNRRGDLYARIGGLLKKRVLDHCDTA
jgi:hypothetical protein